MTKLGTQFRKTSSSQTQSQNSVSNGVLFQITDPKRTVLSGPSSKPPIFQVDVNSVGNIQVTEQIAGRTLNITNINAQYKTGVKQTNNIPLPKNLSKGRHNINMNFVVNNRNTGKRINVVANIL